ncbi:hypothetical protein H8E07_14265 [bacterium]|nr:hypothetical protein [bacterium]
MNMEISIREGYLAHLIDAGIIDEGGLFGEIGIAKGFMTESQLTHLLRTRKELSWSDPRPLATGPGPSGSGPFLFSPRDGRP